MHLRTVLVLLTECFIFAQGFNLIIIHTNDVHAHIEQMNKYEGQCKKKDSSQGLCYGGVARRYTKINEIRRDNPRNTLLLDAGDQYQGTLWFNIYKGQAAAYFMNKIGYDAMTIGNHEFDNGVAGLVPFLENVTFPVLNCNMDISGEPRLQGLFNKSTILVREGRKIGIIGYLVEETKVISHPGKTVIFDDVVTSVRKEVKKLQSHGVDIIIGLGHYGYGNDMKLAKAVEGLDVIVGGHTHTFLYTGTPPANDKPEGPYPTIITNNGKKVLVVQDFFAGKYLGFINVTFSDAGDVKSWQGEPILLDNSTIQDPSIINDIIRLSPPLIEAKSKLVGFTSVYLEGDRSICRLRECNMGNLITDSMISYHVHKVLRNNSWTDGAIALMNSGGIRAGIEIGNITEGDVLTLIPFGNQIDVISISGKYLREALEHSVANYNPISKPGAFLQVSGLKVTYDLCKPSGSRVLSVLTRCRFCRTPMYSPLDENKIYDVITPDFIINGGDGFAVLNDHNIKHIRYNDIDYEVFMKYLETHDPIVTGTEERITLLRECSKTNTGNTVTGRLNVQILLSILGVFLYHYIY